MTIFDQKYKKLLFNVYNQGFEEVNERTGSKTKILTGAHFDFRVIDFPVLTLRKIPLKLFIAEQIWYLQGKKELDFFQQYSKVWDDFAEEDNTAASGYGYRWRNFYERDQIAGLLEMFEKEPSSRQGVVMTWDPNTDGLASPKKKNVPCVPVWIANIVGGELNFHIVFRSNDLMLGFPHDVAGFALLQHIIAQKIGAKVGWMHYSVSHAHVYENHYPKLEEMLVRSHQHSEIHLNLPANAYDRAIKEDGSLVEEILEDLHAQYHPMASVGKMRIAL